VETAIIDAFKTPSPPAQANSNAARALRHLRRILFSIAIDVIPDMLWPTLIGMVGVAIIARRGYFNRMFRDRSLMEAGWWKSPAMLKHYDHLSPSCVWQAVGQLAQAGTWECCSCPESDDLSRLLVSGELPGTRGRSA
jgi:hypothetical protein